MTNNNEWIKHDGGECPVDGDMRVDIKLRDGYIESGDVADGYRWAHDEKYPTRDIIEYRIHVAEQEPVGDDTVSQAAYHGAMEDKYDWKRRALEAEATLDKLWKAHNAENGATYMGEPLLSDSSVVNAMLEARKLGVKILSSDCEAILKAAKLSTTLPQTDGEAVAYAQENLLDIFAYGSKVFVGSFAKDEAAKYTFPLYTTPPDQTALIAEQSKLITSQGIRLMQADDEIATLQNQVTNLINSEAAWCKGYKELEAALQQVLDSGLLSGSTILHDETRQAVREAIATKGNDDEH